MAMDSYWSGRDATLEGNIADRLAMFFDTSPAPSTRRSPRQLFWIGLSRVWRGWAVTFTRGWSAGVSMFGFIITRTPAGREQSWNCLSSIAT